MVPPIRQSGRKKPLVEIFYPPTIRGYNKIPRRPNRRLVNYFANRKLDEIRAGARARALLLNRRELSDDIKESNNDGQPVDDPEPDCGPAKIGEDKDWNDVIDQNDEDNNVSPVVRGSSTLKRKANSKDLCPKLAKKVDRKNWGQEEDEGDEEEETDGDDDDDAISNPSAKQPYEVGRPEELDELLSYLPESDPTMPKEVKEQINLICKDFNESIAKVAKGYPKIQPSIFRSAAYKRLSTLKLGHTRNPSAYNYFQQHVMEDFNAWKQSEGHSSKTHGENFGLYQTATSIAYSKISKKEKEKYKRLAARNEFDMLQLELDPTEQDPVKVREARGRIDELVDKQQHTILKRFKELVLHAENTRMEVMIYTVDNRRAESGAKGRRNERTGCIGTTMGMNFEDLCRKEYGCSLNDFYSYVKTAEWMTGLPHKGANILASEAQKTMALLEKSNMQNDLSRTIGPNKNLSTAASGTPTPTRRRDAVADIESQSNRVKPPNIHEKRQEVHDLICHEWSELTGIARYQIPKMEDLKRVNIELVHTEDDGQGLMTAGFVLQGLKDRTTKGNTNLQRIWTAFQKGTIKFRQLDPINPNEEDQLVPAQQSTNRSSNTRPAQTQMNNPILSFNMALFGESTSDKSILPAKSKKPRGRPPKKSGAKPYQEPREHPQNPPVSTENADEAAKPRTKRKRGRPSKIFELSQEPMPDEESDEPNDGAPQNRRSKRIRLGKRDVVEDDE